jgi:signal peptidase II
MKDAQATKSETLVAVLAVARALLQRYAILAITASLILIADIVTKRIVEAQIPLYTSIPVIGPYLSWTHTQNTGAAFSLFQNGGAFFIVIAIVVSAVIVYYAPRLAIYLIGCARGM